MSETRDLYERGECCSCHLSPPCRWCVSMTAAESEAWQSEGELGLIDLWQAQDEAADQVEVSR